MGTNCTTDSYYLSSVAQESVVGKGNIDAALAKYNVSAMVFPAPQSLFSAVAGYPQVVVPMGFLPENTTAVPVGYHPAAQTYDPFPHTPFGLTL
jgi:amidase